MVDNEILKTKLKNKIDKLGLSDEHQQRLMDELNRLSNLLIDIYLNNNSDGATNK